MTMEETQFFIKCSCRKWIAVKTERKIPSLCGERIIIGGYCLQCGKYKRDLIKV